MAKTTVHLPKETKRALGRTARATGRSEAELIRHGIRLVIGSPRAPRPTLPLFDSAQPHLAEQVAHGLDGFGE